MEVMKPFWLYDYRQYFSNLNLSMNRNYFNPTIFDVVIQDLDEKDLHNEISRLLSKPYLHQLQQDQNEFQETRMGIIYGNEGRGFIALPTRADDMKPIWVHYLIDTASPYTYLTESALKALKGDTTRDMFRVSINGHICPIMPSTLHFSQINILGMDFLMVRKSLHYDLEKYRITLSDQKNA